MIRSQLVQQNFSRASARYDAHATLQKHWRTRVLANGVALFPEQARLLDIGCGTGAFALEAQEVQPGWRITGIDLAGGMCRIAAQSGSVIQGDASALPVMDAACDGVVSSLCLQWVANMPATFMEIARVLKPGGYAVIMTLGARTLEELRLLAPELRLLSMHGEDAYHQASTQAGLEIIAMDEAVERHAYPSVLALLRSFRQIGAQAAFETPPQPWKPSQLHALADAYRHAHAAGEGIAASWQPLLLILRKPEQA